MQGMAEVVTSAANATYSNAKFNISARVAIQEKVGLNTNDISKGNDFPFQREEVLTVLCVLLQKLVKTVRLKFIVWPWATRVRFGMGQVGEAHKKVNPSCLGYNSHCPFISTVRASLTKPLSQRKSNSVTESLPLPEIQTRRIFLASGLCNSEIESKRD